MSFDSLSSDERKTEAVYCDLWGWVARISKSYPFFLFFINIIVLCLYYYYKSKNDGFKKKNRNAGSGAVSLGERTRHMKKILLPSFFFKYPFWIVT
jgi:hypothetical protein